MTKTVHLTVRAGETWERSLDAGFDLTGYSARATVMDCFDCPVLFLDNGERGGVSVSGSTLTISLTPGQTAGLEDDAFLALLAGERQDNERWRKLLWSCEVEASDGTVTRAFQGTLYVERGRAG